MRRSMPGSEEPLPLPPNFQIAAIPTHKNGLPDESSATATTRNKPSTSGTADELGPPDSADHTNAVGNASAQPGNGPHVESKAGVEQAAESAPAKQANTASIPAAGPAAPAQDRATQPDRWEAHPAARNLPADFWDGDPFRDDPQPEEKQK
jgi:hypothetical protein